MIKITQMNEIDASDVASNDLIILQDVSTGNTKKLQFGKFGLPASYSSTMTANEAPAWEGGDHLRCFLNPFGADYNFDPDTTFPDGFCMTIINVGANQVIFDSTGISEAVGAGQKKEFYYDGTSWY